MKHKSEATTLMPGLRDPVPVLLAAGDPALACFVRRDLLQNRWGRLPCCGSCPSRSGSCADSRRMARGATPASAPGSNYAVLETFRSLGVLVEMYGCDRSHPALQAAAETRRQQFTT